MLISRQIVDCRGLRGVGALQKQNNKCSSIKTLNNTLFFVNFTRHNLLTLIPES